MGSLISGPRSLKNNFREVLKSDCPCTKRYGLPLSSRRAVVFLGIRCHQQLQPNLLLHSLRQALKSDISRFDELAATRRFEPDHARSSDLVGARCFEISAVRA